MDLGQEISSLAVELLNCKRSSMKELRDADSWHYRGEGAANIVVAYHGDDPELIGKVLRLRKSHKGDRTMVNAISSAPILSLEEQNVWADWPNMVSARTISELNHVYAREVLCPLLGDKHVDPGTLVHTTSSFIETLDHHLGNKRPAWRAESGSLWAVTGIGLLISDHTCFPAPAGIAQEPLSTVSVELKPKCGFLPTTPMIKEEESIKKSLSRFTMHQQLKFQQGKIEEISKYDPLDLFSGTRDGILKAIEALFENPQNNLRIFFNGVEIFGASRPSIAQLDDILEGFVPAQAGGRVQAFQELVASLLLQSDILSNLLAVQKLDYHDIEGAIQIYEKFVSCSENIPENTRTTEKRSRRDSFEDVSQFQEENGYRDEPLHLPEKQTIASSASIEDCRKILRDFLISATAKDCGLMLSLQPLGQRSSVSADNQNTDVFRILDRIYLQKVLLLDLDVKRIKKMKHYFKLDQEIVQNYKSSTSLV